MKPLVNKSFSVAAGATELVTEQFALFGQTLWTGMASGTGDFTLRLYRGRVDGSWLPATDEDISAGVAEPIQIDLLCPGARLEIANAGGSPITVSLSLMEVRYGC